MVSFKEVFDNRFEENVMLTLMREACLIANRSHGATAPMMEWRIDDEGLMKWYGILFSILGLQ